MDGAGNWLSSPKRARSRRELLLLPSAERGRDLISDLPDECTQVIFGFLPSSRDRCASAAVSKKWLLLLAQMRGCHFTYCATAASGAIHKSPLVPRSVAATATSAGEGGGRSDVDDTCSDEEASRCLEAREANDARLAAMAVGTYARKLLGKLSVRCGRLPPLSQQRITDFGLHIVSQSFPNLKALALWDCFKIGSPGLASIAQCCRALERLDISNAPGVGDDGLVPIARNCPNLSALTLESCPLVGNRSLEAVARCSAHLESVSISRCPLVGDAGVVCMVSQLPSLVKVRLSQLRVGHAALDAIGKHRSSIKSLILENLTGLTMAGFSWAGLAENLEFLSVTSCDGLTDAGFGVGGGGGISVMPAFACLKHVCLKKCGHLTDAGLVRLTDAARLLEALKLERCNGVTTFGLLSSLKNCSRTLKVLSVVKCDSIGMLLPSRQQQQQPSPPPPCPNQGSSSSSSYPALESLTIKSCPGIEDGFLSGMAPACANLRNISLVGLAAITDRGLLSLLRWMPPPPPPREQQQQQQQQPGGAGAARVSLSGCVGITDWSVLAVARAFGGRLQSLSLEGCRGLGDMSLEAVGELCPGLAELDVSGCGISDCGLAGLAARAHRSLEVLSLAGCSAITDRSLGCLVVMCSGLVGLNLQRCRGLSPEGVDSVRATLWWCDLLY